MEVLKVGTNSKPNSVAGAIAGFIREQGEVELQAVGAGAVNQAVKAVAIASGFLSPQGYDIVCKPAFSTIKVEGEDRTAIKMKVEPR